MLSSSQEIVFNGMFCMCPGIDCTLVQKPPSGGKYRTDSVCRISSQVQEHRLWIRHWCCNDFSNDIKLKNMPIQYFTVKRTSI